MPPVAKTSLAKSYEDALAPPEFCGFPKPDVRRRVGAKQDNTNSGGAPAAVAGADRGEFEARNFRGERA